MIVVYGLIVAALTVGGALVWIALLLWAARADGDDQRAYDSALRRYREAEQSPPKGLRSTDRRGRLDRRPRGSRTRGV
jgi:hypothetical protein